MMGSPFPYIMSKGDTESAVFSIKEHIHLKFSAAFSVNGYKHRKHFLTKVVHFHRLK